MTDAELIAAHIASHGVTVCPPATYSPGYWDVIPLREQVQAQWITMKKAAAVRKDAIAASLRANGKTTREIAEIMQTSREMIQERLRRHARRSAE